MAHRCDYKVKYEIHGDRIIATYTAYWKNKILDILQHTLYLCGAEFIKARDNLRFATLGGWFVAFPDEKETFRYHSYGNSKVKLGDYELWNKMPSLFYEIDENEGDLIERLIEAMPEYKYLIQKLANKGHTNYITIMKHLQLAEKYPHKLSQIEWLVENSQENLITDNNLKKGFNPEVINYIKEHKQIDHLYLKAVELAIKTNANYWDCYDAVCYFLGDLKLQAYLETQNADVRYYKDYKDMCKRLKKKWDDPYWKYPKDLKKAHDKVMDEIHALKLAEERDRLQDIANKIKLKTKYSNKHKLEIDNLVFYFPYELEDIQKQAKELNQCLIACNYHIKYANKEKILIFIKRDNKPYATAEISKNKEIKQFYLNEKDRSNCHPTESLKEKLNVFLQSLPKQINI